MLLISKRVKRDPKLPVSLFLLKFSLSLRHPKDGQGVAMTLFLGLVFFYFSSVVDVHYYP
jgi:hypothetical protein